MAKPKSELRKDYVQEKYVIISPRRGKSPHDTFVATPVEAPQSTCVFCKEQQKNLPGLYYAGGKKDWKIKVISNKFPAVTLDNPKAYGQQEVVIETPVHNVHLHELSINHIKMLFDAYSERTKKISKNENLEYLLIFKNSGGRAGASLRHSHSQIFATSFIPPHLFDKSQKVQEYKLKNGTCVYCDVIAKERKSPRFIWEDKHAIAFCPYASIHNYEVWILPKRHLDNVSLLNDTEKKSFAKVLKYILHKADHDLQLPYNYYFHQVINDEDQHLYMKITPRGSVWAGVEIGSGIVINPVAPEDAAKFYKEKIRI